MTVRPKISMYINLAFALIGAVGGGALALPDFIPPGPAHTVVSTAAFIFGLYGVGNAYLHGFSAPQAGPLVTK